MNQASSTSITGGRYTPAVMMPSVRALRWLLGIRLVVVSTLFLGVLVIQLDAELVFELKYFYGLILASYGLSLVYLVLYVRSVSARLQAMVQLLGDIGIVSGFVYLTGGLYSPFSFLYLTVIVVAATLLRGGGLIVAGLSAVAYGVLVDLMVFRILPVPPNLAGFDVPLETSHVLYQLMIHVVGFGLVAVLASYLSESLRTVHTRLEEQSERAKQFVALTEHVVRSVGTGILATDLDGGLLHLNPAGARILGVGESDELTGHPLEEIMPLVGKDWKTLRGLARERPLQRLSAALGTHPMSLGLSVGPLRDERGTLVGFIVNFQDLTELEAETERRRLRERMAAVGEMAARMAHEIKNPLASISGSAQMLTSVATAEETGRRLLRIVVDESRRLSDILDDFLEYARPERGTQEPCDLPALLADCVDLLRRSHELRDHHNLRLQAPTSLVINGEPHLLRQLFWNLSRNALQAMPEGGDLEISVERVKDSALLRWRDTGVGMDDEVRRRAFEPFVTTRPEGTGLGLAVVYAAVQSHGGTITIDSSPGRGTSIAIELPLRREVAA